MPYNLQSLYFYLHHLSPISNADLILVIRKGDIVEQGNHEELVADASFYAELYNSQFEVAQMAEKRDYRNRQLD
jgi:ATP-binding cassette subfamily B protein